MSRVAVRVLLINGPVGVGKTTVSYEVRLALRAAGVAHVLLDDEFGLFYPQGGDGDSTRLRALSALWSVYVEQGFERLVLSRAVKTDRDVEEIRCALGATEIRVFTLTAPLEVINRRIEARAVPTAVEWCRSRAAELIDLWRDQPVAGHAVEAGSRTAADVG